MAKVRCNEAGTKRCPNASCEHAKWHDKILWSCDDEDCWLEGVGKKTMPVRCVPRKKRSR